MKFLKKLLGNADEKNESIQTTDLMSTHEFWDWFRVHEKTFFEAVKTHTNIEEDFFDQMSPMLSQYKENIYFLSGMCEENIAELILTPDGNIKNIVFVEELIASAPQLPNWRFTALKPVHDMGDGFLEMAGYKFGTQNLSYYAIHDEAYPDEVDIVIVYDDFVAEDERTIGSAIYLYLDNFLGELKSITTIDNLTVVSRENAKKDPVPLTNLPAYLEARELSFIEKYEGMRYNTEEDEHSVLEATLQNGCPLIALVNTSLLKWDSKASHPWVLEVVINYQSDNDSGMPNKATNAVMETFENELLEKLKDHEGYLNIGRETADNERVIYFACKDYKKSSKVVYRSILNYANDLNIDYFIFKDKYWKTFQKFQVG